MLDQAIKNLAPQEVEAYLIEACADPVLFLRDFLSHLFPTPIPWFHRGAIAILTGKTQFLLKYGELDKIVENFQVKVDPTDESDDAEMKPIFHVWVEGLEWDHEMIRDLGLPLDRQIDITMDVGQFTLLMMPRGFSKTSIAGIGIPLYNVVFEEVDFTLYISEAGPHARMQMHNVKRELSGNEMIRFFFGDLKPKLSDDEMWSQDLFETTTGMTMAARGRGSQVRGLNHLGNRPKKIICDDLEDPESTETDLQRVKVRRWAYGDLMPALAELDPNSTIVALGTMLHKDCLLQTWSRDKMWTVVKFAAHAKNGECLWPLLMDENKYQAKKHSFQQAGLLHVFYMEYDNTYRADETAIFKKEHLQYGRPENDPIEVTSIYIDPAISEEPDADFTAICVVSMTRRGNILVRDYWQKRGATPREQIDKYFEMAMLHQPQHHGVETNAYQKALQHLLREEMARFHYFFEIKPITHTQKKDQRIRGIVAPRFAGGYIWFVRRFIELETELLDYPAGKVDGPDSLAGAIALCDPHAALAGATRDAPDVCADEYPPLEEIFDGDWRTAP